MFGMVKKARIVDNPYDAGQRAGYRTARAIDRLFATAGKDEKTRYAMLLSGRLALLQLPARSNGQEIDLAYHDVMKDWIIHLPAFIKDMVENLRRWIRLAEKHGMRDEFDAELAERIFDLTQEIARDCRTMCDAFANQDDVRIGSSDRIGLRSVSAHQRSSVAVA